VSGGVIVKRDLEREWEWRGELGSESGEERERVSVESEASHKLMEGEGELVESTPKLMEGERE